MKLLEQLADYVGDLQDTINELKDELAITKAELVASEDATAAVMEELAEYKGVAETKERTLIERIGDLRLGESLFHGGPNAVTILNVAGSKHKPRLFTARCRTEDGVRGGRAWRLL